MPEHEHTDLEALVRAMEEQLRALPCPQPGDARAAWLAHWRELQRLHPTHFILEGHTPVAEPDLGAWRTWMETHNRHVADEQVGALRVSTIFLGFNLGWMGAGEPLLFETMVFDAEDTPLDDLQGRYATWAEAEAGHAAVVAAMRQQLAP
jgi:hypothetical protein